ncbi:MAG: peptidylprolyl isomerase [Thermodesulfobacteriota bacterium]|nr:peptidylprolyl isomerase [Thermodesulfobacteriota bacterium]
MVNQGSKVKVHYTGKLTDGTVFDKSEEEKPLEFTVGNGQVIPGFDKAVTGMELDEEKDITIAAQDSYGEREDSLVGDIPKTSLPEGFEPEKDMMINMQDKSGKTMPGIITALNEDSITIDLNHPLAGKDLSFNIKVVGIE